MAETKTELVVEFKMPHEFEHKEYTKVDLSGIEKMTVNDLIDVQKNLQSDAAAAFVVETTTAYAVQLAQKASGRPIEFFQQMNRTNMQLVKTAVAQAMRSEKTENAGGIVTFDEPYIYNGKEKTDIQGNTYDSVDLNKLKDLNTLQEIAAENRLASGGFMVVNPSRNYLYVCILCSMASGLPVDFFTALPAKEAGKLRDMVNTDFFE